MLKRKPLEEPMLEDWQFFILFAATITGLTMGCRRRDARSLSALGYSWTRQVRVPTQYSRKIIRTFSPDNTHGLQAKDGKEGLHTRQITLQTTLDHLAKEAKRWLKERANVGAAAKAVSH